MGSSSRSRNGEVSVQSSPRNQYYKPAPAEIKYRGLRFLVTDRPTNFTIKEFIQELEKHGARDVVRVCEPTYETEPLKTVGIEIHDMEFSDGTFPPKDVLDCWFRLIKNRYHEQQGQGEDLCIAVHCVAGLGRAPVLVALALMEAGMEFEDAVEIIRQHRRGAINHNQLMLLEKYKIQGCLKNVTKNGKRNKDCCIM